MTCLNSQIRSLPNEPILTIVIISMLSRGEDSMTICVVGLGYIGLPTALMLGSEGQDVIGVDYSADIVGSLVNGNLTFEEDGLDQLYKDAVERGLRFTTDYVEADVYIIAVPTPYVNETKQVDASYVMNAVNSALNVCNDGAIIVIESTIPPGTIDKRIRPLVEECKKRTGKMVHLAHAPERIIPGDMLRELRDNNRTIGADHPEIAERVRSIYASFCKGEIALTDIKTAEMSKVVENTFRDINIAYANELVKICDAGGLDVYEVIRIANKHPRVNILSPGPGVGGHCISVDPWFLVGDYPEIVDVVRSARHVNDSMPEYVLNRVSKLMGQYGVEDLSKVGFYGLTYKENVDDVRESPTLQLYENMMSHLGGNDVRFYDPYVKADIVKNQYHSLERFLDGIDIVVLMVAHDEIFDSRELLRDKFVLDTRHCLLGENITYM